MNLLNKRNGVTIVVVSALVGFLLLANGQRETYQVLTDLLSIAFVALIALTLQSYARAVRKRNNGEKV